MAPLMLDMPRPRWPHLLREVSRHGTVSWVVRVGHGPRMRLTAPYGTPEFEAQYHAAIRGEPVEVPRKPGPNTLHWLWEQYRKSSTWKSLKPATRRQRENIMLHVLEKTARAPLSEIERVDIVNGREERSDTPSQANNFLNTMRALYAWALEAEKVKIDPTVGVKNVKRPDDGGFHAWTETEIDRFEAYWPVGTRERLAFAILLYTGLRRGDATRVGPEHVQDGIISMIAEKTGTLLTIPILPTLAAVLSASEIGKKTFIARMDGKAMVKEGFGNWFRDACKAAGVPGAAHGLRKAGAARAASNGATVNQLEAIFGWEGGTMASLYTKSADRIRLATEAMSKLERRKKSPSIPNSDKQVRDTEEKTQ